MTDTKGRRGRAKRLELGQPATGLLRICQTARIRFAQSQKCHLFGSCSFLTSKVGSFIACAGELDNGRFVEADLHAADLNVVSAIFLRYLLKVACCYREPIEKIGSCGHIQKQGSQTAENNRRGKITVFAVDAQDALERPNFGFDRPHGIGLVFSIFH